MTNRLKAYVRRTMLTAARDYATGNRRTVESTKAAFQDAMRGTDTGWWNDLIYTAPMLQLAHRYRRDIATALAEYRDATGEGFCYRRGQADEMPESYILHVIATARRARRMIGAARSQERIAQARANAARAEIDRLKRDMADPSQPERASDIARLVQERDTARTALAAMAARAERAEQGLHSMADRFEGLVSRVTRAEAALRQQNVA